MISSDRLNIKQIRAHWDEILRFATSIKQGTVTASLMLRKLGSYPRQNGLAVALRELGRIERTLFILDWLQSVELRRRVQAGLNKGEARNALARWCSSTDWAKSATAVLSNNATGPAASIW
jgi:TnpA family transposase